MTQTLFSALQKSLALHSVCVFVQSAHLENFWFYNGSQATGHKHPSFFHILLSSFLTLYGEADSSLVSAALQFQKLGHNATHHASILLGLFKSQLSSFLSEG